MFIGSLLDPKAGTDIKYSYKKRGTDIAWLPTYRQEAESKELYGLDGKLFNDFVGYSGYQIVYGTFDIVITLGKKCYVDHVAFEQTNSKIGEINVLTKNGSKYRAIGKYSPETGKLITDKELSIELGAYTDNLILRFKGECEHIIIGKLNIFGATETEELVYPIPKEISFSKSKLTKITGIKADGTDALFAAENFREKLLDSTGISADINGGNISFELCDTEAEAFSIKVDENGAIVKGGSRRALLYASEKLLQLCDFNGIRCAEINDSPFMGFRGAHFALPSRDKIPFLKRMIKYLLIPMGYNTVILQLSGAMEYKHHPEINEGWLEMCRMYEAGKWPMPAHYDFIGHDILTHEEIAELCAYIRAYGLEVIPEVQSFAHAQYITHVHPELAEEEPIDHKEFDLTNEDAKPNGFYAHTMCPNHPGYYPIIFDLIDEAIEVIKPERYVHIGHDEIYTIGKCHRCKDIPPEEIFLKEVTALNDYIKNKGLNTMMWSDMLQEHTRYATTKAIGKVSKDIVCLSFTWYFNVDIDNEDVLYDNGYDVIIGNFYSSHFPRFNKRKYGERLLGAQVSTWVNCNELYWGFEGKTYDFIYSAGMMWNEEYREDMRRTYTELIKPYIENIRANTSESVMSADAIPVKFEAGEENIPYDIRNIADGAASVGANEEICIPFGEKAAKLSFIHATDTRGERVMWTAPQKLGEYIFNYADGSTASFDILYGANIAEYARTYGAPLNNAEGISPFRHEGYFATALTTPIEAKTFDGRDVTLCRYTIVNPSPEKDIKDIVIKHSGNTDVNIMVFDIFKE